MPAARTAPPSHTARLAALVLLTLALWLPRPVHAQDACAGVAPEPVLALVNTVRARGLRCGGVGPLVQAGALGWSARLAQAAQRQAEWLAEHGPLVHVGPRGEPLAARVAAAGYRHARISENLAAGQDGVFGAVRAWEASASHCRALIDPGVTETALACAPGQDGEPVWVMLLGRPQ
jgi:uncharacterized protein YkwD